MRYIFGILCAGTSAVVGAAALFIGSMACDEACHGSGDWSRSAESWQWDAIQLLGAALFVTALVILFHAAALRVRSAVRALGGQLAVWIALFSLISVADYVHMAPEVLAAAAVPLFLGGATVLAAHRARRVSGP